jgi:hypothetical protein
MQRHPNDIPIIQEEAKRAEDERQRMKAEAMSTGNGL